MSRERTDDLCIHQDNLIRMTSLKLALCLTSICLWTGALTTDLKLSSSVRQDTGFLSRNVGDSVTLRCFYKADISAVFFWYKQTLGQKPRQISSFYKHDTGGNFIDEFKNNSRFKLDSGDGKYHLTITDLQISDSATYYCVGCYAYQFEFSEGMVVSVTGSGSNIPALVHQSSSDIIQPGGSVTLNCTVHTGSCDGEHSVYWFKTSQEESHPGLIYTHGGRNDQCERKDDTQTHTCVYNLPMENLNVSHAGTYYCAVASCGHILFGNGIKLEVDDDDVVLVYFLSITSVFATALTVLLAFSVCMMNKSCLCSESQAGFSASSATANLKTYQNEDHLYDNVGRENKLKRRRQRDDTWTECVYFSVKQ